jgi:hypothetical protein
MKTFLRWIVKLLRGKPRPKSKDGFRAALQTEIENYHFPPKPIRDYSLVDWLKAAAAIAAFALLWFLFSLTP